MKYALVIGLIAVSILPAACVVKNNPAKTGV